MRCGGILLIFWTNRWSAQFPTITRFGVLFKTKVFEAQTIVQLGCEFIQNMAKFQCCVCGFLFIFYHIPEDYSVDNYSIWCIRKIFYLHLSIPRAQANTVQHTYLIVVSIISVHQTIICLLYVKSLRNLKKLFNWQSKQILI